MKKTITSMLTLLGLVAVQAGWCQAGADAVPVIARDQVKTDFDAHSATLVEALAPKFYKRSHLPGSLNIPMSDAETLIPKLLPDKKAKIIVYCMSRA
jgi:rhodanese-related sulfurtransferase